MKHLKQFENITQYESFKQSSSFVLPNVSYCIVDDVVLYNPGKTEEQIILRATYNAVDNGENGMLCYGSNDNIKSVKIDGVDISSDPITEYTDHYEINNYNTTVDFDSFIGDCPDEFLINGAIKSWTLKPKNNSIILNQDAFDSGNISVGAIVKDGATEMCIPLIGFVVDSISDMYDFNESNNSISLNDMFISENVFSYSNCAFFLLKYNENNNSYDVLDTVVDVEYTLGGLAPSYYFETEGYHEAEFILKDKIINNYAFRDCSSLTSVTIPNSVTSIGDGAFYNCGSLTSVTIPGSVKEIGYSAFESCNNLVDVIISNGVTLIGERAFVSCDSLTNITIPSSVNLISMQAFRYCNNLTNVTIIGSGITSIGDYAFRDCSSLTSITIGNGVTSIGDGAFYNCDSLTSVTIPDSVTLIGKDAFGHCENLTNATIGNGITSIGESVFHYCISLMSVTLPDGVTSIGNYAFNSCRSLTSITIPDSVTSIGDSAFSSCSSLTGITIPNSVTSIGKYAFESCTGELIINNSLFVEKDYTSSDYPSYFGGWLYKNNFTKLTIGNNVTKIGDYAFRDCSSLTSVTIPNSVTSIGESVFNNCDSLTSIVIPDSVTEIKSRAFIYCDGLTHVYCKPIIPPTSGSSVFFSTHSNLKIYVPTASVDAYKAASNWSTYSTKITGYNF